MAGKIILMAGLVALTLHSGSKTIDKSGIFIDGKIALDINSARKGGSIADPEKGSSFRFHLIDKDGKQESNGLVMMKRMTDISDDAVYITGFRYKDKEYKNPGSFVDRISLKRPIEAEIELDQGVYKGGNPDISSVKFNTFDIDSENEQAKIYITIKMTSGKRIDIAYTGGVQYDGIY